MSSLPATRPSAFQPRLACVEYGSAGKMRMLCTMYSLSALVNMLFVSACSRPRCAAKLCFEHGWRVTCLQCVLTQCLARYVATQQANLQSGPSWLTSKQLTKKRKENRRKDYAFRRQFNEKPSIIPGLPRAANNQ